MTRPTLSSRRAIPLALLLGCSSPVMGPADVPRADASVTDASEVSVTDVSVTDVSVTDVPSGSTPIGGACVLNRECAADARCACPNDDCRCALGPRGTGRAGVTACAGPDDCASSLCVDGTSGMLCSDACATASDCPPALPRCVSVGALGISLCARDPNATADAGASGTSLAATFGSNRGAFDRAQHGRSGATGIYVEAHFGGDPACPTMSSPTPRRTLVVSGIRTDLSAVQTAASGLRVTLLDFSGDLVSTPVERASAVTLTPVALGAGTRVRFSLRATFAGGEVQGEVDAPWCMSLDE